MLLYFGHMYVCIYIYIYIEISSIIRVFHVLDQSDVNWFIVMILAVDCLLG